MISEDRDKATATYAAEQVTINNHGQLKVNPTDGDFLKKPGGATHLKLQAIGRNIRYRIDGKQAGPGLGFRLVADEEITLPVSNDGISVAGEDARAVIEYQWLR